MTSLHSAISKLEKQYQQYQDLIKSQDPEALEKVTTLIQGTLDEISQLSERNQSSPAVETLKFRLAKILHEIDIELHSKEISQKVGNIGKLFFSGKSGSRSIDMMFGFLLDVDSPDYNGVLQQGVLDLLNGKTKMPFVCTRSILLGQSVDLALVHTNNIRFLQSQLNKKLFEEKDKWIIFTFSNSQGEEFLFFLPNSGAKTEKALLESYDLKGDGTLKRISIDQALEVRNGEKKISQLKEAFSPEQKKSKLPILRGHGGGSEVMGGLRGESFAEFISLMHGQGSLGLIVQSCSSGGAPSQMVAPTRTISANESASSISAYEKTYLQAPFPVIVRSIGDFPTSSGDSGGVFELVTEFKNAMEGAKNELQLRESLAKLNKGEGKARFKAFFPTDKEDIPTGFRSFVEKSHKSEALTYVKATGGMISETISKKATKVKQEPKVKFIGKKILDLYPMIFGGEVHFSKGNPLLVSMIPGNARHFIKKISFESGDPEKSILETLQFHGADTNIQVNKVFIIGKMEGKTRSMEGVVLVCNEEERYALFREGGKYYRLPEEGSPMTEISEWAYLGEVKKFMNSSSYVPGEDALRVSTGGQESPHDPQFGEAVAASCVPSNAKEKWEFLSSLPKMKNAEEFMKRVEGLPQEEVKDLCFELLAASKEIEFPERARYLSWVEDAMIKLIEEGRLSPDASSLSNEPLLITAICRNCNKLIKYLFSKDVNVSVQDREGATALHFAALMGNENLVERLIDKKAPLNAKVGGSHTPLHYALSNGHYSVARILIAKGANVNELGTGGGTPLLAAVRSGDKKRIEFLLSHGADPNIGKPSSMSEAVLRGNLELIKMLIENGGKPFTQDALGAVPFIEAIYHGRKGIVDYLLTLDSIPSPMTGIVDGQGFTPHLAALYVRDKGLFNRLTRFAGDVPLPTDPAKKFHHISLVEGLILSGEADSIGQLIRCNRAYLPFTAAIAKSHKDKVALAEELYELFVIQAFILKKDNAKAEFFIGKLCESVEKTGHYALIRVLVDILDNNLKIQLFRSFLETGKDQVLKGVYDQLSREDQLLLVKNIDIQKTEEFALLIKVLPKEDRPLLLERAAASPLTSVFFQLIDNGVPLKGGNLFECLSHFIKRGDLKGINYCLSQEKSFTVDEEIHLLQMALVGPSSAVLPLLLEKGIKARSIAEANLISHLLSQENWRETIKKVVDKLGGVFPTISEKEKESIFKTILHKNRKDEARFLIELGMKINKSDLEKIRTMNKTYKRKDLLAIFEGAIKVG